MKKTSLTVISAVVAVFGASQTLADPVQWTVESGGNGHWYEPIKELSPVTWTEAQALAEQRGGYLTCITSQSENDFVFSLASSVHWWSDWTETPEGGGGPWLGGYQDTAAPDYSEPAGGWRWVSGEPWAYTNWHPFEPNNYYSTGEDALQFAWVPGSDPALPSPYWNDSYHASQAIYPQRSYVVEYSSIPEPATLSLLALGIVVLLGGCRMRRQS